MLGEIISVLASGAVTILFIALHHKSHVPRINDSVSIETYLVSENIIGYLRKQYGRLTIGCDGYIICVKLRREKSSNNLAKSWGKGLRRLGFYGIEPI